MGKLKLREFDLVMFDVILVKVHQIKLEESNGKVFKYTYEITLHTLVSTENDNEFPIILEVDGVDDTFDEAALRGYGIANLFTGNVDNMINYLGVDGKDEYIPIDVIIEASSGGF